MPTFSQEPLVLQDTHYSRKKTIYILKMKESLLIQVFYVVFFNLQFRDFDITRIVILFSL